MINTYKNYIIAVLMSALVFMPFFGVSFSSTDLNTTNVVVNVAKQTSVAIVAAANPQVISESASLCVKGALFNLNQSGGCFSKIVLGFNTPTPVYSVVVAPFAKLITTVSVIRLWFTNHALVKGLDSLPIILTAFLSLLLMFSVISKRNLFTFSPSFKNFYPNNPSLSLLQVYRC